MKLISWNVNGLRACEGKGFSDIFKELDADLKVISHTGTMLRRKAIPALPSSRNTNR